MQKLISTVIAQFKEFFKGLGPTKRMSLVGAVIIAMVTIAVVIFMVSGRDYVPLFTNVPPDQATQIIDQLRKKNIPFQLTDGGATVTVPREVLHSTQMALMTELGSSRIGTIGLELFDKQDFGATSYTQRINFQRALQGELARAVITLEAVKNAKVMLALPAKKTFLEEGGVPTASVVVELKPGKALSDEQVRGIQYLVSSAVENLENEKVSVIDSRGKLLSSRHSSSTALSGELHEMQKRVETDLEDKVEGILKRVVGEDKIIAKVDVTLNHRQESTIEERVDPDRTAIRSIQTEEENLNGARNNPAGVPGARSNLPGAQDTAQVGFNQNVKKELKTTNYSVPKTVRNVQEGAGSLERVSVAVLVDGNYQMVTDKDGNQEEKYTPRTPEELKKYEQLVKNAIGFNEKRGDSVTVENMQFQKESFGESEKILTSLERRKLLHSLFKWGLLAFSLGLLFFLVVRPFMQWITDSFQDSVDDMLPRTIEELEELQAVDNTLPGMSKALPTLEEAIDPDKAECELLKDRILNLIENGPDKAADAFNLWLVRKES